ncbi:hypothetical protein CRYUN_Cryun26dG0011700 [Craigia yunnanensis]
MDCIHDCWIYVGEVIAEAYELEYGTDCLEMHVGAVQPGERAIVIDDLVATGGTLSAATRLLERVGAQVVECACVIGLREVKVKSISHLENCDELVVFFIYVLISEGSKVSSFTLFLEDI